MISETGTIPNHHERQMMQQLRGGGWVKASELPETSITLTRLLEKRWIERKGFGKETVFRLTDKGLAAKTAPIVDGKKRRGDERSLGSDRGLIQLDCGGQS